MEFCRVITTQLKLQKLLLIRASLVLIVARRTTVVWYGWGRSHLIERIDWTWNHRVFWGAFSVLIFLYFLSSIQLNPKKIRDSLDRISTAKLIIEFSFDFVWHLLTLQILFIPACELYMRILLEVCFLIAIILSFRSLNEWKRIKVKSIIIITKCTWYSFHTPTYFKARQIENVTKMYQQ